MITLNLHGFHDFPIRPSYAPDIKSVTRASERMHIDYSNDCRKLKDVLRFAIYVPGIADFCTVCAGADLLEKNGVIKVLLRKNRCV